jgi:hypothetical protein
MRTSFWEELAECLNLKELEIPDVPSGLLPLVLHNKNQVQRLEVGELTNQMVYYVCFLFKDSLRSLSFHGGLLSYSGVASLIQCKDTLIELSIKDPKYLTKIFAENLKSAHSFANFETLLVGQVVDQ